MKAILSLPPYATHVERAVASPVVEGVRLNTVLPVSHDLPLLLRKLRERVAPRTLWIDLKCRQLRVAAASYVPYHHVELSHPIEVATPVQALFNSGAVVAIVRRVEGNRLYLEDVPPTPLGAGMSVTILDPSLRVLGYLTPRDREYIAAARGVGLHTYMLSFVEDSSDLDSVLALDPDARLLAKIESRRGLSWVANDYPRYRDRAGLIAARGDLYLELEEPAEIVPAMMALVRADPEAVAGSRILSSLEKQGRPDCAEVSDLAWLASLGYRRLLLGDELGFQERIALRAVAALEKVLGVLPG